MKTTVIAAAGILAGTGLGLAVLSDTALAQKPPPPPPPPPLGQNGQAPEAKPPPPANAQPRAAQSSAAQTISSAGAHTVRGEVWVDNWFRFFVDGKPLAEDSVPLTTERSFNAERFDFQVDYPMTLAFEFRDFMENATGLEYIGTRRQQMGDGGAIAQFTDLAAGKCPQCPGGPAKERLRSNPLGPIRQPHLGPGPEKGQCRFVPDYHCSIKDNDQGGLAAIRSGTIATGIGPRPGELPPGPLQR